MYVNLLCMPMTLAINQQKESWRERDRGRYYFSLGNFFYDRDQRERETDGDRERGVSKSIYVIPLDKKMKGQFIWLK